jgi:hypothetical protein
VAVVEECLRFANDCLQWAADAETEVRRTALLKMAGIWLEAASRGAGVVIPGIGDSPQPPKRRRAQARH